MKIELELWWIILMLLTAPLYYVYFEYVVIVMHVIVRKLMGWDNETDGN